MKEYRSKRWAASGLAVLASLFPSLGLAEEAAEESDTASEDAADPQIIVTGTVDAL